VCQNTQKHSHGMWLTTESESLMDIPELVSFRQAVATPVCRYGGYECCSARNIFHTIVVGLAMPRSAMSSIVEAPPMIFTPTH